MKLNVDQALRRAQSAARKGDRDAAERLYRDVLAVFPANRRALEGLQALAAPKPDAAYEQGLRAALALYDQGRLREMLDHVRSLIDRWPSQPDLYNLAGVACAGLGRFAEALEVYERAAALNPRDGDIHANRAIALERLDRPEEALESCDAAIRLQPASPGAHLIRGMVLRRLCRLEEAAASYETAIRLDPRSAEAHYNRGNLLHDMERFEEAVASYDAALAIRPGYPAAMCNRGNALRKLGQPHEALKCYDRAIALDPGFAEAHSNRGSVLHQFRRFDEALESCARAVELQPGSAEIHYNLGTVQQDLQRHAAALASYDAAIRLAPDHDRAHANRGGVLLALGRAEEALESYDRAVALRPEEAEGHYNRGNVLQQIGRLDEAIAAYRSAIALRPDYAEAQAQLLFQQARVCDWSGCGVDPARLGIDTAAVSPFALLAIEDDPARQLLRARRWVSEKHRGLGLIPPRPAPSSPLIRVGYFSADFHNHATMHLIAGLLERHDRSRFEIHAFSYGTRRDDWSERARQAVDVFHEVGGLNDREIAAFAREQAIDVAVDLKGHTQEMRLGIFSHRAAPVQIAYLGYPGTTGAPFIDYLVVDEVLVPERSRAHYAEKLISLPGSYQINDDRRPIADRVPKRAALGLPERGFVFCSFNASYKIRPAEFSVWMRLLTGVEGSVLWLLADNRWAEANLRAQAAAHGIDPARLVFAPRTALPDHLARHRCADLFLDSFHCNAHTTASDALWAGLPLLTKAGESFAARVAASLLTAAGLPELVTTSAEEYEALALALALATDPVRLAAIRERLLAARASAPLFDTLATTRHLERAYAMAHERHLRGERPASFTVPMSEGEGERAAA